MMLSSEGKMLTQPVVAMWLDAYVRAWKSYDPADIAALFTEDAEYFYSPFDEPLMGREAIVESWLDTRDIPGTYDAAYQPLVIEGNTAVTNGRSTYFEDDGTTIARIFDNIFVLHFDDDGRCTRFCEWYMQG
jgi:ketosteroid isomerase-like protein